MVLGCFPADYPPHPESRPSIISTVPQVTVTIQYDTDTQAVIVVDKRHEWAVHRALGEAMQPESAPVLPLRGVADVAGVTVNVEDNGAWDREMVHALSDRLRWPAVRRVLDLVATASPAAVPYKEALAEAGIETDKLRAELASMSKLCRDLFGRKAWPMTARQGMAGGSKTGYRMPKAVAEWWLEASRPSGPANADGGPRAGSIA